MPLQADGMTERFGAWIGFVPAVHGDVEDGPSSFVVCAPPGVYVGKTVPGDCEE